jgi:hypothetical protein
VTEIATDKDGNGFTARDMLERLRVAEVELCTAFGRAADEAGLVVL